MKTTEDNSIFHVNKWTLFLVLCVLTFLVLYMKKSFVENETTAFQILDQRGEMGLMHTVSGLQYITIPLVYLYKFTITAFVIWVGCFMFGYKISFGQTWHVTLVGEFLFLGAELLKIFWFIFFVPNPNIFDIQGFYPLSLVNFVDIYEVSKRYLYPLKALNLFEVGYWFVLVYGIHTIAKKRLSIAYAIIFTSYVPLFLLWLVFYTLVYK